MFFGLLFLDLRASRCLSIRYTDGNRWRNHLWIAAAHPMPRHRARGREVEVLGRRRGGLESVTAGARVRAGVHGGRRGRFFRPRANANKEQLRRR